MTGNRRSYERYGADMVFWIKMAGASDEDFLPFDIRNISGGGILVYTNLPLKHGDDVILSFELPQHTDLIEAQAEVRHVHDEGENAEIGLQFSEVKGLPTALLIDYLEEIFK